MFLVRSHVLRNSARFLPANDDLICFSLPRCSYLNKQNYLSVKTESRKCRIKERKLWKSKNEPTSRH
ncbi:hypothetical protein A4V04_05905 [Burkholderiales bacterium YL45]|uniref:Uncharacterized protein n=1 Tax=Turicimonas muris TaxID=1796652 RepID=A0A227KNH8_9BURK|nr:hypothetical protein A4V04_05905 [Burkholderiales bacterium YL45]OXE49645.1 hypothetical protein ADH67_05795 [Turicimonas muris]